MTGLLGGALGSVLLQALITNAANTSQIHIINRFIVLSVCLGRKKIGLVGPGLGFAARPLCHGITQNDWVYVLKARAFGKGLPEHLNYFQGLYTLPPLAANANKSATFKRTARRISSMSLPTPNFRLMR